MPSQDVVRQLLDLIIEMIGFVILQLLRLDCLLSRPRSRECWPLSRFESTKFFRLFSRSMSVIAPCRAFALTAGTHMFRVGIGHGASSLFFRYGCRTRLEGRMIPPPALWVAQGSVGGELLHPDLRGQDADKSRIVAETCQRALK